MKYRENQRCSYWEFKGLLLLLGLIATYRLIEELLMGPDSRIWTYVAIFLLLGSAYYLISRLRMQVVIGKKSIKYAMSPLDQGRKVKWKDIESFKVVDASVASQFSGWNKHFLHDQSYFTLVGRKGLQIFLKDGQELFIGLQKPSEVQKFLEEHISAGTDSRRHVNS